MSKVSEKSSHAMDKGGTVTDASKRQIDEQSEWSFPPVSPTSPLSEELTEILFPCGISSLEQWGKVIISMGAWKDQNISFAKAVATAKESDKMRQCLSFILGKFGDKACEDPATNSQCRKRWHGAPPNAVLAECKIFTPPVDVLSHGSNVNEIHCNIVVHTLLQQFSSLKNPFHTAVHSRATQNDSR